MDQDKSHMTKSILKLTLEIIYLLTGEDCTVVKKISSEHVTPQIRPCVSGGLGRSRVPIMVTPPCSHERDNDQRILLLTDKIIQLLTGEVPIRCQDVTVHFSLEEWEYLEEHKDLYKDVMMENHQSFISLDRSSNRDAPERCPRPLYSQDCTDENHGIPQEDQGEDLADNKVQYKKGEEMIVTDIKVEYTEEEEETYVRGDQQCKEEEIPTDIGTDGPSNRNTPERCPLYSQDWTGENHRIPQEYQGGGLTDVKVEEEMYVRGDQQCKEEEIPTAISTEHALSHVGSNHFSIQNQFTSGECLWTEHMLDLFKVEILTTSRMPLTAAERMRRRREKMKEEGKYEEFKRKHREAVRKYRQTKKEMEKHLSKRERTKLETERRLKGRERVARFRRKLKEKSAVCLNAVTPTSSTSSPPYKNMSTLGKATARSIVCASKLTQEKECSHQKVV